MLNSEIFSNKYSTTYKQIKEESFLEEISEEDRQLYEDSEILTGRNRDKSGSFNKFNNFATKNKNKTYNTIRGRMMNSLKRYFDEKINEGKEKEIWDIIWNNGKKGDFQFAKLLKEMMVGKEVEKIDIKVENIEFELKPDKNAVERQKENLKNQEKK